MKGFENTIPSLNFFVPFHSVLFLHLLLRKNIVSKATCMITYVKCQSKLNYVGAQSPTI